MKLFRFGPPGAERPGVVWDNVALEISEEVDDFDAGFWENGGVERLDTLLGERHSSLPPVDLSTCRFGPPIPSPSKLICIGLNYAGHIRESGADIPTEPVVFMKAPNTLVGPNDDVTIPPGSQKTDYEVELAVVIGRTSRYLIDESAALKSIAGYTISNDISEREYQLERGGQWVKGKSFETFNPLGPYLVTTDAVSDPMRLSLELRLNGQVRQQSNTADMVFSPAHIVWYLSQFMVLEPGDIINTGTPPGVGMGMNPPAYLKPGDEVETSIEGLGVQLNVCKQA